MILKYIYLDKRNSSSIWYGIFTIIFHIDTKSLLSLQNYETKQLDKHPHMGPYKQSLTMGSMINFDTICNTYLLHVHIVYPKSNETLLT